ncbi:LPS assembly protein LptD [bacterium]|nr:LPS assembly protein LptD [bacterium]
MKRLLRSSLFLPALGMSLFPAAAKDRPVFAPEIHSATLDSQVNFDDKKGVATATDGIIVAYEDAILTADKVTFIRDANKKDTGEVIAEGHVRIQRGQQIWIGEKISYNFVTGHMTADKFRTGQPPFFIAGVNLDANKETGIYTGYGVTMTTDDYEDPAQKVEASSVGIMEDDYAEVYSATLKIGKVPILWLPYMKRSLKTHPSYFTIFPGYSGRYGAYGLSAYHWSYGSDLDAAVRLDYRSKRGIGTGADLNYDLGRAGKGDFSYYWTDDHDAGLDANGDVIDPRRQRFRLFHEAQIDPTFTARAMVRYQNDEYIIRDFFEDEYRENVQPSSWLELHKGWSNFSLNTLAQPQLNGFQETVERLPDVKFSAHRQQLGDLPLYYESETDAGWFRRRFADNIQPSYSAFRGDSYHQIVWPNMFFGWLNVMPRVGGRFTYYSEAEGGGATTMEQTRGVFNTGAEVTTKASRLWPGIESKFWDVDGLRHIIQPAINYVYVPQPSVRPPLLPQFDYELDSIRLLPIEFPDYNSIDSIDSQNTLRLGLFNKLQTHRNDRLANIVQWNAYTDWRLDKQPGQRTFADLFSELDFAPREWLLLTSEVRLDVQDPELLEANHYLTFTPQSNWSWSIGHRFMRDDPARGIVGNNLLINRMYYKLNENWGLSTYQYFDIKESRLQEHTYSIYRDLRSWTGALSFRFREDDLRGQDFTVAFVFSLKAVPSVKLGDDRLNSTRLFGN